MTTRLTIKCQSYRVRLEAEQILLEIDDAKPASMVPQLMSKAEVSSRLDISQRKIETLAASGRLPVVRIDGCLRFREEDVLQFLKDSNQEPLVTVIPRRRDARN